MRTDGQADRDDQANSRFFFIFSNAPKDKFFIVNMLARNIIKLIATDSASETSVIKRSGF